MAFVCMKDETNGGYTALCYNSNRHPNEAQEVVIVPEQKINDCTIINCTYSNVLPPKTHSHRCMLCKPVWCWGASSGSNSAGISICVKSIIPSSNALPQSKNDYLTGMDLARLALKFGDCALDAVKIIDHYLSLYETGGIQTWMNSGSNVYFCSFLIAEYNEVWLVETMNQMFVAKKFNHGMHTISSQYCLSSPFDLISNTLRDHCDEQGIDWKHELSMNKLFGSKPWLFDDGSKARMDYIEWTFRQISQKRKISMNDLCDILRSDKVCARASFGPLRTLNTNNSMICILTKDGNIINFVTGTSSPFLSTFKPLYIGCSVPKQFGVPFRRFCNGNFVNLDQKKQSGMVQTFDALLKKKNEILSTANALVYNSEQLWWKHEVFHRHYEKYFVCDEVFNAFISCKIRLFEEAMFGELVDEYVENNCNGNIDFDDEKLICEQSKIIEKYWNEADKVFNALLAKTKSEIVELKKKERNKYKILCPCSLTKCMHKKQWNYWNRLCGMEKQNRRSGIWAFLFGDNMIYKFVKILLLSAWSAVAFMLGLKYFNS